VHEVPLCPGVTCPTCRVSAHLLLASQLFLHEEGLKSKLLKTGKSYSSGAPERRKRRRRTRRGRNYRGCPLPLSAMLTPTGRAEPRSRAAARRVYVREREEGEEEEEWGGGGGGGTETPLFYTILYSLIVNKKR